MNVAIKPAAAGVGRPVKLCFSSFWIWTLI